MKSFNKTDTERALREDFDFEATKRTISSQFSTFSKVTRRSFLKGSMATMGTCVAPYGMGLFQTQPALALGIKSAGLVPEFDSRKHSRDVGWHSVIHLKVNGVSSVAEPFVGSRGRGQRYVGGNLVKRTGSEPNLDAFGHNKFKISNKRIDTQFERQRYESREKSQFGLSTGVTVTAIEPARSSAMAGTMGTFQGLAGAAAGARSGFALGGTLGGFVGAGIGFVLGAALGGFVGSISERSNDAQNVQDQGASSQNSSTQSNPQNSRDTRDVDRHLRDFMDRFDNDREFRERNSTDREYRDPETRGGGYYA